MRFTLRQISVFLAIARTENVSIAAKQINLSQSAASTALKNLEDQLNSPLFDRIGKRLQLNERGRFLLPHATTLMDHAHCLEQELMENKDMGSLKVGATLTIGNHLTIKIIADFNKQYPGSEIDLEVANTKTIANKVLNYDIDIGLVEGEYQHPDLKFIPWRQDEMVIVAAADSAIARKRKIEDKHLIGDTQWIVREKGSGTRQAFERAMHGLLPELSIKQELQHTSAIKQAVELGMGATCLSRLAVQDLLEKKTVKIISAPHRNLKRNFYFVLHKDKYLTGAMNKWMDFCKQYDQSLK